MRLHSPVLKLPLKAPLCLPSDCRALRHRRNLAVLGETAEHRSPTAAARMLAPRPRHRQSEVHVLCGPGLLDDENADLDALPGLSVRVLAFRDAVQHLFDQMRACHLSVSGEAGRLAEVFGDDLADPGLLLFNPPVVRPGGSFEDHLLLRGLDDFVGGLLFADALATRVATVELFAEVLYVRR